MTPAIHLPLGRRLLLFRHLMGQKGMVWSSGGCSERSSGQTHLLGCRKPPGARGTPPLRGCGHSAACGYQAEAFCLSWGTSAFISARRLGLSGAGQEGLAGIPASGRSAWLFCICICACHPVHLSCCVLDSLRWGECPSYLSGMWEPQLSATSFMPQGSLQVDPPTR